MIYDGTGSVEGGTGWYLVVLGQYNSELFGMKWYWVSIGFLCLYIETSGYLVVVTIAGRTTKRKDRATQSLDHGRLR